MKLKIKKIKIGDFEGDGGEPVEYRWIKAERADGVTIEFGTRRLDHSVSDTPVELNIEKTEKPGGGFKYREVFEHDGD